MLRGTQTRLAFGLGLGLGLACVACTDAGAPRADAAGDGARDAVASPPGCAASEPAVAFAAPLEGAVVRGVVDVLAAVPAPACVRAVELRVDGTPRGTATAAPYRFAWDTAAAHDNPLPPASHPLLLGYYYADGRYGDFTAEVNSYTNLYVALPRGYDTALDWHSAFRASLEQATRAARRVLLAMDDESLWPDVLAIAAPYWDAVDLVEVGHEPSWTRADAEGFVTRLRAQFTAHGLASRRVGITYAIGQALTTDAVAAAGLDWVGIEAYVDPPGSPDPAANVATLRDQVSRAMARVPAPRQIVLVPQAYDRNGLWPDIATLTALQAPPYLLAHDDPRVVALALFSYARPGGTRDHPELRAVHQQIGERVLGVPVGALSNGPHALELRATDAAGRSASATVHVVVAN